jgi:16S rRNA (guanine966-N2)-methyltransferase
LRIVGGAWRGRRLVAPAGFVTRPTADRVRQALFDMLLHAPWGGAEALKGVSVLDAFAGTGALGLEALSRGAGAVTFFEPNQSTLRTLCANIARCDCRARCTVHVVDATRPPPGAACELVFLDPPYHQALIPRAMAALTAAGWIAEGAVVVGELSRDEPFPEFSELLDERVLGATRLAVWHAAVGHTVQPTPSGPA